MARRRGPVELAVWRDFGKPTAARQSGLAALAFELARRLDDREVPDRDAAALAGKLLATLAALPRPAKPQEGKIDQLRARREARRTAAG